MTSIINSGRHLLESLSRTKCSPCVYVLSGVCLLRSRSVWTSSATAAFCQASGAGKTAFTRRDGHRVGDGDALPGGREEVRDAGMQAERRGAPITYKSFSRMIKNLWLDIVSI